MDPLEKYYDFGDLCVREKAWRSRARGAKATRARSTACSAAKHAPIVLAQPQVWNRGDASASPEQGEACELAGSDTRAASQAFGETTPFVYLCSVFAFTVLARA